MKKTEKKIKQVLSEEGDKIDVEACPNCNSELVVKTKEGAEVFECENCKFVKHKKEKKKCKCKEESEENCECEENKCECEKEEEKKEEKEEFPDVEIGFDPFAQQN